MNTDGVDIDRLNLIKVPLAEVRAYVAGLMRDGQQEISMGDLLYALKDIVVKSRAESETTDGA